jgi:uncharacterized repeat protein (TIGR03803 family)
MYIVWSFSQGSCGTVFQINPSGALTSLYSFTGGNDGGNPQAGLVQGSDGSFYGTANNTYCGPTSGTVFKISSNGVLSILYTFTGGLFCRGLVPSALVQGSDGSFYGTTDEGGTSLYSGTVFRMSATGTLTSLYSFTDGNDGGNPQAGLVQGSDGDFYGTTSGGGTNGGYGTVFKISTNGALTRLYSFGSVQDTNGVALDGAGPVAGLVQGSDGYIYGMTYAGGTNYYGTVFRISTNGVLTSLYSFTGGNDGGNPQAALVQASDGSFYGTTGGGGAGGAGTVFRLTIVPQPQLTIIPSEPYVILTWPTNYSGFTLQSTTNLGSSAVWSTNSSTPVVIGEDNVVINAASGKQQFFRLSQ